MADLRSDQPETPAAGARAPTPDGRDEALLRHRRQMSVIILLLGLLAFLALPFVLSAGSAFFLPIVTAAVISVVLSPLADWLYRRGVPNVAASSCAILFMIATIVFALTLIVTPAIGLAQQLPEFTRILQSRAKDFQALTEPIASLAKELERATGGGGRATREVVLAGPSVLEQAAFATPVVLLESVVTLLLAFFMLESRIRMRRSLLLDRVSVTASLKAARTVRQVSARVARYLSTVGMINIGVGVIVGVGAWLMGLSPPVMWGGLAAFLNFLPYVGPLLMVVLLGVMGLATAPTLAAGMLPALAYLGLHAVEANVVTPTILGRTLTLNPVAILISIAYFTWIWGGLGAILSMPILIVLTVIFEHFGRPNIVGFMLGEELIAPPTADDPGESDQPAG